MVLQKKGNCNNKIINRYKKKELREEVKKKSFKRCTPVSKYYHG